MTESERVDEVERGDERWSWVVVKEQWSLGGDQGPPLWVGAGYLITRDQGLSDLLT